MMKGGSRRLTMPKALMAPSSDADQQGDDDRRPDRHAARQHHGDDRAGEADDRADGQIDTGGDDDEGLPHRHDRPHRILAQQILEIAEGREAIGRHRQQQPQHDEQSEQRQVEQKAEAMASQGGALRRRDCGRAGFRHRWPPSESFRDGRPSPSWLATIVPRLKTCSRSLRS